MPYIGWTKPGGRASDRAVALTASDAADRARRLYEVGQAELLMLDDVRRYWTGKQRLPAVIPSTAPVEVRLMAQMARVNVVSIVVESLAQSLAIEGFRAAKQDDNHAVWQVWQGNRLDARQSMIHRPAIAYGVSYAVVTPGQPVPLIRGLSPRRLTAMYEDDEDWPTFALERRVKGPWRLYDATTVYEVTSDGSGKFELVRQADHGAGVTPVVRYLDVHDPDWDDEPTDKSWATARDGMRRRLATGQVAPLMSLQDQIDLITFNLLVAQHYTAFRQRWIIGWVAPDETTKAKANASLLWTFDEAPDNMKIGEFSETALDGYIKSRDASFRQAAALSQTPVHELVGDLVNLSADALAAAEAGRDRKVGDRQTTLGESHEQTLALAGKLAGIDVPPDAQVVWRDTSARAYAATIDALGKLATMLGVPAQELWERIPGVTQQDVERWRATAATGDALTNLAALLERQGGAAAGGAPATGTQPPAIGAAA